jgi:putative beta-lysine N-acetyltransferase
MPVHARQTGLRSDRPFLNREVPMPDRIETIGDSVIQHGKQNDRIYLIKLGRNDYPDIIDRLEALAEQNAYSKIFAKVPEWAAGEFRASGYIKEAEIPNFYNGRTDACFFSQFRDEERSEVDKEEYDLIRRNIRLSESKTNAGDLSTDDIEYTIRRLNADDVTPLAALYRAVFNTYPFPIFKESYLLETMNDHVIYFGVFSGTDLVAASSSEMDVRSGNAEMTDFATLKTHRGKNLSLYLLSEMESEMKELGIKTVYTIARALSPGMNITFAKMGYRYSGTLINNTCIAERIESMNVWYKFLNDQMK